MTAIVSHYVNKTAWPRGVWDSEPDGMQGYDKITGFPFVIDRRPSGAFQAAVGVTMDHPAFGCDRYKLTGLAIHAGIDFAEPEGPTCPVRHFDSTRRWWIGFHCDHHGDRAPTEDQRAWNCYRPWSYVETTVTNLATLLRNWKP